MMMYLDLRSQRRIEAAACLPLRPVLVMDLRWRLHRMLQEDAAQLLSGPTDGDRPLSLSLVVTQLHRVANLTVEQLQLLEDIFMLVEHLAMVLDRYYRGIWHLKDPAGGDLEMYGSTGPLVVRDNDETDPD